MIPALLTSILFATAVSLAKHSVRCLGPQRANLTRQFIALLLLGLWAHLFGQGWSGPVFGTLFLSGVIGFGIGDWALYEALPRIGPGLTALLSQCLAAPIAALTEWLWLGTALTSSQYLGVILVLTGVGVAVYPRNQVSIQTKKEILGVILGIVAGFGQAWGAVLSRQAFLRASEYHFHLDGLSSAYQRLWGGIAFGLLLLAVRKTVISPPNVSAPPPNWREGSKWALANALSGAVLGVGCYQWALQTTSSAVVLPIVAMTPLLVMMMTGIQDRQWPSLRVVLGALLAIAGVLILVGRH